eukprot:TRINITY_DN2019_c0_g1_i1.p1 TRINITY_DN2019_c0_g1~~TRINITY_DN2019_c0_g1_i1.p1  ORF type:complete len:201 (-),score=23.68 TRINITY_DN2019_c0_g1_i1:47-649(-)
MTLPVLREELVRALHGLGVDSEEDVSPTVRTERSDRRLTETTQSSEGESEALSVAFGAAGARNSCARQYPRLLGGAPEKPKAVATTRALSPPAASSEPPTRSQLIAPAADVVAVPAADVVAVPFAFSGPCLQPALGLEAFAPHLDHRREAQQPATEEQSDSWYSLFAACIHRVPESDGSATTSDAAVGPTDKAAWLRRPD